MRRLIKRQRKPYFHKPEGLKRTLFKRLRPPKDFTLRRRGLKRPTIGKSELEKRAVSEDKVIGTLPERIVWKELARRRITFDFQSSLLGGRLKLGGMVADFILYLPLGTLILRVQTQYFHTTHEAKLKDDEQRAVLESLRDPISGKYYIVYDLWDQIVYDSHRLNDWLNRVLTPKAHTFYMGGPARGVWMPNKAEWEALIRAVGQLQGENAAQEQAIDELERILAGATLADITGGSLGLVTAGELRCGDGKALNAWTGVRMAYDPDNHTGVIEGRAAGTKQFYLDTDGKAYAGAGDVILDTGGITIQCGAEYLAKDAIDWKDGAQLFGTFYTQHEGDAPNRYGKLLIKAYGEGTGEGDIWLDASSNYGIRISPTDGLIHVRGGIVRLNNTLQFNDANTALWKDASSNLSFKDAVAPLGAYTLEQLAERGGVRVASDYASGSSTGGLAEAQTDLGASDGVVYLGPASYPIDDDLTILATTHLVFAKGASCAVANTKTLTINGTIEAGLYQIFSWAGTGAVVLGHASTVTIFPQWWGAVGDDSTDDSSALTAAFAAITASGPRRLVIPDGTYRFNTGLTLAVDDAVLMCIGTLKWIGTGAGTALTFGATGSVTLKIQATVRLVNLTFDQWATAIVGVAVINCAESTFNIVRLGSLEAGQYGFQTGLLLRGSTSEGCVYNKFFLGAVCDSKFNLDFTEDDSGWVNENVFFGGRFSAITAGRASWAGSYNVRILYGNNIRMYSPSLEQSNYEYYYYCDELNALLMHPRIEGSPTYKIFYDANSRDCEFVPGNFTGSEFQPYLGCVDLGLYNKWAGRRGNRFMAGYKGGARMVGLTAVPTTGTWAYADQVWKVLPAAGGSPGWVCVTPGTYSAATDNTGDTTNGSPTITGMTDTSDFYVGEWVTISAGFAAGDYRIIAKTATSVTLGANANATVANVTVATPDPVWKAMANLAA